MSWKLILFCLHKTLVCCTTLDIFILNLLAHYLPCTPWRCWMLVTDYIYYQKNIHSNLNTVWSGLEVDSWDMACSFSFLFSHRSLVSYIGCFSFRLIQSWATFDIRYVFSAHISLYIHKVSKNKACNITKYKVLSLTHVRSDLMIQLCKLMDLPHTSPL